MEYTVIPLIPQGIGSNTPADIEFHTCSSPLSKIMEYLHITFTHLPYTFFFFSLGPHQQHLEVPRLGVKSEP